MDESQTRRNRTAAQDGEDVRPEGRRLSPFSFVEGVLLPRLENGIVAACAFAILLTVTLHISFRYLGQSFRWTEEAARLGTIWGTFFAVPIFVRRRGLLAITVLHPRMSQRALARLSIATHAIIGGTSLVLLYLSYDVFVREWARLSPGLQWPTSLFTAPVGITSAFIVAHVVELVRQDIQDLRSLHNHVLGERPKAIP